MPTMKSAYPEAAYAEAETLFWQLENWPGTKRAYGDERKLAAWIAFNVEVGETFTMRDLREALGDGVVPNDAEHLNRRLRRLRPDGWSVPSNKDDRSLAVGTYRLDAVGWHPGDGQPRPRRKAVSQAVRRRVIDRDGRRCVVCGVGANEPYPGEPGSAAVLTAGHRFPEDRRGSADENNLQAECRRCNEPMRQEIEVLETLDDLVPDIRNLRTAELTRLESWLLEGHRTRDRTDEIYDRARKLSYRDRQELEGVVRRILARG